MYLQLSVIHREIALNKQTYIISIHVYTSCLPSLPLLWIPSTTHTNNCTVYLLVEDSVDDGCAAFYSFLRRYPVLMHPAQHRARHVIISPYTADVGSDNSLWIVRYYWLLNRLSGVEQTKNYQVIGSR